MDRRAWATVDRVAKSGHTEGMHMCAQSHTHTHTHTHSLLYGSVILTKNKQINAHTHMYI